MVFWGEVLPRAVYSKESTTWAQSVALEPTPSNLVVEHPVFAAHETYGYASAEWRCVWHWRAKPPSKVDCWGLMFCGVPSATPNLHGRWKRGFYKCRPHWLDALESSHRPDDLLPFQIYSRSIHEQDQCFEKNWKHNDSWISDSKTTLDFQLFNYQVPRFHYKKSITQWNHEDFSILITCRLTRRQPFCKTACSTN